MVILLTGSCIVKPAEETPNCVMYVSDFDQIQPMTHAPTVYFYRQPSSDSPLKDPLQIIKHSLSKVLTIFYPLAGRLQWSSSPNDPSKKRVEINCNSAGALVLKAESDSAIDDFGDFCPTAAVEELLPPINYKLLPLHQQPLLLVQLTKLRCGGIVLGLRISHVLVDGMSASHFISEWSGIARGKEVKNTPFLDRTVLKPPPEGLPVPSFDHSDLWKSPLLIGNADDKEERGKETTPTMFRLSKEQVATLKRNANDRGNNSGDHPFTRYEVVSAHMWRCACKARGHKNQQETVVRIAVNFRNRVVPNLPKWYFGNGIVPVAARATSGKLLAEPLSYACGKIREAINKVNDEYIRSCLSSLNDEKDLARFRYHHVVGSQEGAFFGNPNLNLSSWLSVPLHGADFGWGEDIHMGPGLLGFDGKSFMLCGRDEEGSVVLALRLQVAHMNEFKTLFYYDQHA